MPDLWSYVGFINHATEGNTMTYLNAWNLTAETTRNQGAIEGWLAEC